MVAVDFEAGKTGLFTGVADLVTVMTDLEAEATGFRVEVTGVIDRTYTHTHIREKYDRLESSIPNYKEHSGAWIEYTVRC